MKVMLITHSLRRDTAWLWTKYIIKRAVRKLNEASISKIWAQKISERKYGQTEISISRAPADRAKNRLKPQCLFKTETSKIQKYSMFYVQRFIKSILLLHFPSCETCGILRGSDECMSRVTLVQYKPNSTQSSNIPVMKRVLLESHQQSLDCRTAELGGVSLCHKSCVTASISFIDAIGILYNLHHF